MTFYMFFCTIIISHSWRRKHDIKKLFLPQVLAVNLLIKEEMEKNSPNPTIDIKSILFGELVGECMMNNDGMC